MVFLKSLRRCDRKGDVELVLEVEKKLARELHAEAARAALGTMPNSFINLPVGVPHPSRTLPPTAAASVGAAPPSRQEKAPSEPEEESSSDEDSVLSSWTRRYGPSKNDPPIKLHGDTLIDLVTDAKKKNVRGQNLLYHALQNPDHWLTTLTRCASITIPSVQGNSVRGMSICSTSIATVRVHAHLLETIQMHIQRKRKWCT